MLTHLATTEQVGAAVDDFTALKDAVIDTANALGAPPRPVKSTS